MRKKQNIEIPDCQHCEHLEECLPWNCVDSFEMSCKMTMSYDS